MTVAAAQPVASIEDGATVAGRAGRALAEWAQESALPVRAFVYSRLIVLFAGVGGVLAFTKHAPAATTSAMMRQLGPIGSLLAGSADRFDSGYYLSIAGHGYGAVSSGKLAFFPLYPSAIRVLTVLTRSGVIAGVAISAACFLAALIMMHRLTELELGRRAAGATVLLLAFSPLSFFFTAVYTESLFLMLSVATVLAARRGRWGLACVLGALATLTRPTGIVLVIALGVMRIRERRGVDRRLAWVLALPATLFGYMAWQAAAGYGWLGIFEAQAGYGRVTTGPITSLAASVWAAIRGVGRIAGGGSIYHPTLTGPFSPGAESVLLLGVLVLACSALAACVRRLPLEYSLYAAVALILCVSSPDVGQPLWSLDRYTLTIFPLWMAAGAWVSKRRLQAPAVVLGSLLLVFYTVQFSSWAFIA